MPHSSWNHHALCWFSSLFVRMETRKKSEYYVLGGSHGKFHKISSSSSTLAHYSNGFLIIGANPARNNNKKSALFTLFRAYYYFVLCKSTIGGGWTEGDEFGHRDCFCLQLTLVMFPFFIYSAFRQRKKRKKYLVRSETSEKWKNYEITIFPND